MKYLVFILLLCSYKQSATIIEEDGCEYFAIKSGTFVTSITHKGNCSNYIHSYVDTTDMLVPEDQFKKYYARQTNRYSIKGK